MQIINIGQNEAGQRMSKLLMKYLDKAPASFIYKMLRKKNIVLNASKADGTEILKAGDEIKLFLSEDTIAEFRSLGAAEAISKAPSKPVSRRLEHAEAKLSHGTTASLGSELKREWIVYEDRNVLIVNKPFGILSQRAEKTDCSLVEMLSEYLLDTGAIDARQLETFKPSVCNRLDRNTSGLVIAGKTLLGLQAMTELIRNRSVRKFYMCIVKGKVPQGVTHIRGFLKKDEKTNRVTISEKRTSDADERIETKYRAVRTYPGYTLVEVELLTGKTHQIRAHLASVGNPIIGDEKYGDRAVNQFFKKGCRLRSQLLTAYRLCFPEIAVSIPETEERNPGAAKQLNQLSGKMIDIRLPREFSEALKLISKE